MKDSENPVEFEGIGMCFFRRMGFREPKAGEYYLSGAVVQAYRAPNDLGTRYHVVMPTYHAKQKTVWAYGLQVNNDVHIEKENEA